MTTREYEIDQEINGLIGKVMDGRGAGERELIDQIHELANERARRLVPAFEKPRHD